MPAAFKKPAVLLTLVVILLMPGGNIFSQEAGVNYTRLMFYNVENLFDIFDDTLKDDDDFLPDGVLRWNYTRYKRKINSLYKTIAAAGEWSSPDIIALCEAENRKVLGDLVYGTYLSKSDYGILHEESPDPRGIDVCLLYKKEIVDVVSYSYWIPSGLQPDIYKSRSVLYAKLIISGDTLHLIINHWPSRRGGSLAGESLRIKIAGMVRQKIDSVGRSESYRSKVIICGDFNCTPDDREMKALMTGFGPGISLCNLSRGPAGEGQGTYRYRGAWEMIDQVIVSETLLNSDRGLYTGQGMFRIFRPDFLLEPDPKYPGLSPYSTYKGYRYHGGFSDHLPLLVDIIVR